MPAYFDLGGARYELADFNKLEIHEIRDLQRVSGLNQGRIPLEIAEGNVDAWTGILYVSIRRANPEFDVAELDKVVLNDVLESIVDLAEPEEDAPPDPRIASPSESGGSGAAGTRPTPIRATSGIQRGSTTSA
jgi:hypothetical protein